MSVLDILMAILVDDQHLPGEATPIENADQVTTSAIIQTVNSFKIPTVSGVKRCNEGKIAMAVLHLMVERHH